MNNKTKGKKGENIARKYISSKGIEIVEQNYQYRKGEIDLIGIYDNRLLIFFEVKSRANCNYGHPEEFVSAAQKRLILSTAEQYIFAINWQKEIRFDIIAIEEHPYNLQHFEDAFY